LVVGQDDGIVAVGNHRIDLYVQNELIVELKSTLNLQTIDEVQLVSYLKGMGEDFGLLINFGPSVQVKRKY